MWFFEAEQAWYLNDAPEYVSGGEKTQSLYDLLGYPQGSEKAKYLECLLCGKNPRHEWSESVKNSVGELYDNVRDVMSENKLIEVVERQEAGSKARKQYKLRDDATESQKNRIWEGVNDVLYLLELAGFRRHPYHLIFKILKSIETIDGCIEASLRNFSGHADSPNFEAMTNVHRLWELSPVEHPYIRIEGTLSIFCPLLSIAPSLSSKAQNSYRGQGLRTFIDPENRDLRQMAVESWGHNLSFLSGQMVWYLKTQNWVCLGLFQGVCRNSIPVFIRKEFFDRKIKKYFFKGELIKKYSLQLKVFGKFIAFRPGYENDLAQIYTETLSSLDENEKKGFLRALIVDGNHGTKIIRTHIGDDDPMYLDGDLWYLTKRVYSDSCQRLSLTCKTGINLSDDNLVDDALKDLRTSVEEKGSSHEEIYSISLRKL